MDEKPTDEPKANYGPRNSYAPNDGYQYFEEESNQTINYERRRSSLRRNSSLITDADFKNQAYGMLRKRKSPKPNWSDQMLYGVYRFTKVYIPLSSILAVSDFILDWRNAVQLMDSDKCSQKVFGSMMFSTVLFIPMIFAMIHKSSEEYDMWEMIFRGCCGVPQKDPFGDVEEENAPKHVQVCAYIFYILFSPFTHLVTQMSLHTNSAEKVAFYLEFDVRKEKVIKQLHLGCFTSYDGDELDRLKELQFRATHYVQYYIKYAKDRLRYCLIEDTIQFNIQFAMFIYNMFTAPQDHPSTFQYLSSQTFMGISVHPETKLMSDAFIFAGGLITSILMLWQGYFQIERYHEQMNTRCHIGLIRVVSLCIKTMIELLLPSLSLVILMIKFSIVSNTETERMLTTCHTKDWMGNMLIFYACFIMIYSFGINFLWSLILNYCNRGGSTFLPIVKETLRMSIYTACISVKYNRVANYEENVIEEKFEGGTKQKLMVFIANFIRFCPVFFTIGLFLPDYRLKQKVTSYAITNDVSFASYLNQPLRYDSFEKMKQISPAYLEHNYFVTLPANGTAPDSWICYAGQKEPCAETFYNKDQHPGSDSGGVVFFQHFADNTTRALSDISDADRTAYLEKLSNMRSHKKLRGLLFLEDTDWYEAIVEHFVYSEKPEDDEKLSLSSEEFSRYMNNFGWDTSTNTNNAGLRLKLLFSVFFMYVIYTMTCFMSETDFLTSKYLRTDNSLIKALYPLLLPGIMSWIALKIEFSAVENQLKSFCRMYPDRKSTLTIVNIGLQEDLDCINGKHFQSIKRCSYGTVCFYDSRKSISPSQFGDVTKLKKLKIYNNPLGLREKIFEEGAVQPSMEYVESGLIEIYKRLKTDPRLTNTMCFVHEEVRRSQFGDIFYDTRNSKFNLTVKDECFKCQEVLQAIAQDNVRMEQFYSATVNGDVPAIKEAKADIESNTFWTLNKIFTGADDYIQRLNNHLDKELECYNIVPLTLAVASKDMAESTENWDVTYEKKAVNQTTYNFFTKFHESCSTGFRRCVSTESCDSGTFLEADTAKYLIKELAQDSRKSYVVVSADQTEKPLMINWPEQITLYPRPENAILPMIAEMQNFIVGKVEGKSANFEIADSDEDSKKNLPLFNPFYHYAFDVYGTNTMRDLKSIPFHKMGKALDEIHNSVGPWLIPYEPPNVGPAQTNSLPSFRLRDDSAKLIGQGFDVGIINMPRDLRLDTANSLWHYYIHALLFPFSAPLPWWTDTVDPTKHVIQEHTFKAGDDFFGTDFTTKTLYRQITPIYSFLYEIPANTTAGTPKKSNSYFNVPIWSDQTDFKDIGGADKVAFQDWKSVQPEFAKMQKETDPWTNTGLVNADMTNACAVNFNNKIKIFGIGPGADIASGLDMNEDNFKWSTVGQGNRKRFRIDEDYLIYGPGGEGLKRSPINPTVMQYEFDDTLRTAIKALTYKGKSAAKNYEDGMGQAIDAALVEDGQDLTAPFTIDMTYYLFTNLMTHMWPKDYDKRFVLPYAYDWDKGATAISKGVDEPLTSKCVDGEYTWTASGKKMWCIGGPIAFKPTSKPGDAYNPADPHDLRNVTLKEVYKPQAEFIRANTDFFPFMDLGDPFINQTFVDSHDPFGILHKFWDTPSRLKIYSTTKPYSHYKTRFDNRANNDPIWYKPFIEVQEHNVHNLKHVNTYVADFSPEGLNFTDFWDKFEKTKYHEKIKNFTDSSEYDKNAIRQRMTEPADTILPLLQNRTQYDIENWQRLYSKKNKKSLDPGWHFFGREWDFEKFQVTQKSYSSNQDYLDGNEYYAEVLDLDYSLYNVLPNSPIYVRTSPLTEREGECFQSQPIIDERSYKRTIAKAPDSKAGYCDPNIHYVINRPEFTENIAKTLEDLIEFNPASVKYDIKKTYTQFNYGDLHISKPCAVHAGSAYIFGQVRRLKPFYYFYCDKWINTMENEKVNLATDGGKISTRPCSKKILDPLNRFQPWDSDPQTAFANRKVSGNAEENNRLKRPFILSDPEIVSPYSLVFKFNGTDFEEATVLPNGISPRRGSCIDSVKRKALICFGGINKNKATNVAIWYKNDKWQSSNDKDAGDLAEMNLPIPLLDPVVIEVGNKFYILGGRTILSHFKFNANSKIRERGNKFMQYGYRKDLPISAVDDDEFVEDNKPFKRFNKLSGEQMYPPMFGNPAEYGINGHQTPPKQVGQTYADYGETSKFFQFTGLASEGGTGWQQTARPMQAKKWSITSSFYKRKYAYMFASGNAEGVVSRFNVQRTDLAEDASLSENSRKRRSLDFVKGMQGGKHSANTGPFLNEVEQRMIFAKNSEETYLPNDWSTVMAEYFANDYHSGQMCKMCDGPSRALSFQKLAKTDTPFDVVEIPPGDQTFVRKEIAFVMEINHKDLE